MKKLFIVVNVDWFFLSHRLPIALAAKNAGYSVTIVSANTGKKNIIENYGLKFTDAPFERSGTNFFTELQCIYFLTRLYLKERPDIIHHVTLKPSIYGSIAARLLRRKGIVNAISGLGYNFTDDRTGMTQNALKRLIKFAFRQQTLHFIFQNLDDFQIFHALAFIKEKNITIIKGSGVDLKLFEYTQPFKKNKLIVLFPGRMLYDKGVIELVKAANILKPKYNGVAEFIFAGDVDIHNPAVINDSIIQSMIDNGYISFIGYQEKILNLFKESDIVVLPSYREGLPKALIEAAAVGRPIVTTNTSGCKECVTERYNGFLVPVKNVELLADALDKLLQSERLRLEMGKNSRALAEKEFSIEMVIEKTLHIYEKLLNE